MSSCTSRIAEFNNLFAPICSQPSGNQNRDHDFVLFKYLLNNVLLIVFMQNKLSKLVELLKEKMTLVRKNESTFLFSILLEICVQSLKSVIPVVLVPELVKCLPVKNLFPPKFLQPWKLKHKILFKHIFESNYHLSNFLWNLYIITANKSLKQIPVGFPFKFIFLL